MENIELKQEIMVDLDEVVAFINSQEFAQYLLANTSEFSVAAYILQALLDRVEADAHSLDNE